MVCRLLMRVLAYNVDIDVRVFSRITGTGTAVVCLQNICYSIYFSYLCCLFFVFVVHSNQSMLLLCLYNTCSVKGE